MLFPIHRLDLLDQFGRNVAEASFEDGPNTPPSRRAGRLADLLGQFGQLDPVFFLDEFIKQWRFEHDFSTSQNRKQSHVITPQIGEHLGDGQQVRLFAGRGGLFDDIAAAFHHLFGRVGEIGQRKNWDRHLTARCFSR